MTCNICTAIKSKKVVIQKIEKDNLALCGYKISQAIQDKSDSIPEGFRLYWDGTVDGFDFVLNNCDCNANN